MNEVIDEVSVKRKGKFSPNCESVKVYKRGKQRGVQMYKCNACNKWYSEATGTALYEIKLKTKWQSYLRCMEKGLSIKKIAKKLNISIQTSFDWRHKILSSLDQFTPTQLSSQVEGDELELALSDKGSRTLDRKPRKRGTDFKRNTGQNEVTVVQVFTAVERGGNKYLKAVASKRLTKEEITLALDGKLSANTCLISDKHNSYKGFAKDNPTLYHKTLLVKDYVSSKGESIHLHSVNNVHSRLRIFNGISSKYLQNYLNWYAYYDSIKNSKTTLEMWFVAVLLSDETYSPFQLFNENGVLIRT